MFNFAFLSLSREPIQIHSAARGESWSKRIARMGLQTTIVVDLQLTRANL